jgi:hypothetical protein
MRKKSILSVLVIVFYFIVILLCSCNKENPTSPVEPPPTPPDTVSRYKWKVILNYISFKQLYAADTDKIYINADYSLMLFNGINFDPIITENNYRVFNVYGFDKNNIFAPGYLYKNNSWIPAVKKITNGNITTFSYENERDMGCDLLVTGPEQAWLSSYYESKVYYYNNGSINIYRLNENDSINKGSFYLDANNNLYVFARKEKNNYLFGTLYSYKFNGNSFDLIRTDSIDAYNPNSKTAVIFRCGTDAIMLPFSRTQMIYYFNGNEWIVHSSPVVNEMGGPTKIGGISKDSLIAFYSPTKYLYTYGGKKWRLENDSPIVPPSLDVFSKIETKFGNVYITSCAMDESLGWLYIGKPNHNSTDKRNSNIKESSRYQAGVKE